MFGGGVNLELYVMVCSTGPRHAFAILGRNGLIRREYLDHMMVFNERHLGKILIAYAEYYNDFRTHRSLRKDAPAGRPILHKAKITSTPHLRGLHHSFVMI